MRGKNKGCQTHIYTQTHNTTRTHSYNSFFYSLSAGLVELCPGGLWVVELVLLAPSGHRDKRRGVAVGDHLQGIWVIEGQGGQAVSQVGLNTTSQKLATTPHSRNRKAA